MRSCWPTLAWIHFSGAAFPVAAAAPSSLADSFDSSSPRSLGLVPSRFFRRFTVISSRSRSAGFNT